MLMITWKHYRELHLFIDERALTDTFKFLILFHGVCCWRSIFHHQECCTRLYGYRRTLSVDAIATTTWTSNVTKIHDLNMTTVSHFRRMVTSSKLRGTVALIFYQIIMIDMFQS